MNPVELSSALSFSNITLSPTKGQNLHITANVKTLIPDPQILSNPAILDGVLKFNIYDKNENLVSYGYYVAPGYGKFNYKDAGFKKVNTIKIDCKLNSPVNVSELRCEITAESLWFIEKNDFIFSMSNADTAKSIKAIKDYL